MGLSYRHLLRALSRLPFIAEEELAPILGEDASLTHDALRDILRAGVAGRVSHGGAHLDSTFRYFLTAEGIVEASEALGFRTPSEYLSAYPVSKEWLGLLIGRMDAVAAIYRLAATMSPGLQRARRSRAVPPQGRLRRDDHPARRPQLRRRAPGARPGAQIAPRPTEAHT